MIYTFSNFGYEGNLVQVETDFRRGIPAIDIVGIADVAVKETKERALSAIKNSGIEFTYERVLVAFNPCDCRKDVGMSFPLAMSMLCKDVSENYLVLGNLEEDGTVNGARGVHAAVATAREAGITKVIVSSLNGLEASLNGVDVYVADTLKEALNIIKSGGVKMGKPIETEDFDVVNKVSFPKCDIEFAELKHGKSLRALQVAIASGEHILFYGGAGCGKTMIMGNAKFLTPILQNEKAQVVTRIHSLAGLMKPSDNLKRVPPFRMPHQTASIEGICGGGINCNPGEISLAHNGILFLDEASEFRSSVLQMLRVPLETHSITLSRAGRSTVYPANFQLMMSTLPCPCGNFGSKDKICLCSARSIEMYWKKFSAPLLDRVAVRFEVDKDDTTMTTEELRTGISIAYARSLIRGYKWSEATPEQLITYMKSINCPFESEPFDDNLSPRARYQIAHMALTIAEMRGYERPTSEDWAEAKSLRRDVLGLGL